MGQAQSSTTSKLSLSHDRHEVPKWVADEFGLDRKDVAVLEVPYRGLPLYEAICKYFAQRAVDISETVPGLADRIHSDPFNEKREYPGRLSSIQHPNQMNDFWTGFSPPSRQKVKNEDDSNIVYVVGSGWGRVKTDPDEEQPEVSEKDVIFEHFQYGSPKAERNELKMYRAFMLYSSSPEVLKTICRNAMRWFEERKGRVLKGEPKSKNSTSFMLFSLVVTCNGSTFWRCLGFRESRPLNTVILEAGKRDKIVADARDFFDNKMRNWYRTCGVPYRRTFLFLGPPGTGKTSMIRALAGELKLNAYFLQMSHKEFTDQTLVDALGQLRKGLSLLVIEDVDALFNKRRSENTKLTFSGLLNAIDGIVAAEAILCIMTTNHVDKLDPALLRCGRIDHKFQFDLPTHHELEQYFFNFYPDATKELSTRFADIVVARKEHDARSLATMQQHFIRCHGLSDEEAVDKLQEFFEEFFPEEAQ